MGITRLGLRFPAPAPVVACLALIAALGGGASAATSASSSSLRFTNATLMNGWFRCGTACAPAGYVRDPAGVVHLRGGLENSTHAADDTVAFVLPPALRPSHDLVLPAYNQGNTLGRVSIYPDGRVRLGGTKSFAYISLDGISFAAGE
jgi:hypothetical protein